MVWIIGLVQCGMVSYDMRCGVVKQLRQINSSKYVAPLDPRARPRSKTLAGIDLAQSFHTPPYHTAYHTRPYHTIIYHTIPPHRRPTTCPGHKIHIRNINLHINIVPKSTTDTTSHRSHTKCFGQEEQQSQRQGCDSKYRLGFSQSMCLIDAESPT